jgi:hypothetical protein
MSGEILKDVDVQYETYPTTNLITYVVASISVQLLFAS